MFFSWKKRRVDQELMLSTRCFLEAFSRGAELGSNFMAGLCRSLMEAQEVNLKHVFA